jgi:WD40 repeat protein
MTGYKPDYGAGELVTADEALAILDRFNSLRLTTLQEQILRGVWEGVTYRQLAQHIGYDHDYIKYVGSRLWKELSKNLGRPVHKSNVRAVIQQLKRHRMQPLSAPHSAGSSLIQVACDWGDAPALEPIYGRRQVLDQLRQWCVEDHCRLVMLQGQGGIGKTTLARHLAQQIVEQSGESIAHSFERVMWRSLRSAPSPTELLKMLVSVLAPASNDISTTGATLRDWLSLLLMQLTQQRCFVVLDNVESLLQPQSLTGEYLPGCEAYQSIFERVGEESHQSCILLTGRELPAHFAALQARQPSVRIELVEAMEPEACRSVVRSVGVVCGDEQGDVLCDRYGGNPLSLKLIATTIRDVFSGQVESFLTAGTPLLGSMRQVLDEQFARLLPLEQQVMYWLAIHREPMAIAPLNTSFLHPPDLARLVEALDSLWRRCLIETTSRTLIEKASLTPNATPRFTQQPVIMEYVTRRFIDDGVAALIRMESIASSELSGMMLNRYSLLTPAMTDYIGNAQKRLILQPMLTQLLQHYGSQRAVDDHLRHWIQCCQYGLGDAPGYGAGNGVNLLCALTGTVENLDCSGVALWRIDARGYRLRQSNMSRAHFQDALFTETFGSVLCVAFDSTGEWLASGDTNGEIRLWQVSTGQLHQTLTGHSSWVRSLAFHPTDPWLISASNDHTLKVWDRATGRCLHTLTGHHHWVRHLTFSPLLMSGVPILASGDAAGVIYLWNCESWEEVRHFSAHDQAVRAIAFHPNGHLLSGSEDGTLKLWNLATGNCIRTFVGHTASVYTVLVTESGEVAISGSADGDIRLWDIETGECREVLTGHRDAVWSLSLSPDGDYLASASADSTIRIWVWQTGDCVRVLSGHHHWVLSVAFSPQSQSDKLGVWLASGGYDPTVRLWNGTTGNPLRVLQGYTNGIFALTVDEQSGVLVSGSQDGQVNMWDMQTRQWLSSIHAHAAQIWCVALSPNGQWLASGGLEPTIHLWHRETGECQVRLDTGSYWVRSLAFSPDSRWLTSAGTTNDILLWDLATNHVSHSLTGHTDFTWAAIFSPDGQWLASCSNDATVRLWDWRQGICQHTLKGHRGPVESIVFSPGGDWLASAGGDGVIRLWEIPSGDKIAQLTGHTDQIGRLAVSAHGRWLASSSNDQTVRVWDVSTGQCVHVLEQPERLAYAIAFLPPPHAHLLTTGNLDGQITLWNCQTGECAATWILPRPYEGLDITNVTGLTPAQRISLQQLGAVGDVPSP